MKGVLLGWQGSFVWRKRKKVVGVVPLCLFCIVLRYGNRTFYNKKNSVCRITLNFCVIFGLVRCFYVSGSLFRCRSCRFDRVRLRGFGCLMVG